MRLSKIHLKRIMYLKTQGYRAKTVKHVSQLRLALDNRNSKLKKCLLLVKQQNKHNVGKQENSKQNEISLEPKKSNKQITNEENIMFANPKKLDHSNVYRNNVDKSKERLNLNGRNMEMCPILEGEEELRLLNYENNLITHISNLDNLPNLIFLDLHNNKIEKIEGLETLKLLRVLMLGKNCISKIVGLDNLLHLDVLDLHENKISTIENLNKLSNLRILNLSFNEIVAIENISDLQSLVEINLSDNAIVALDEHTSFRQHNKLEKIFLSNNRIDEQQLHCLISTLKTECPNLEQLTFDENPQLLSAYRKKCFSNLKQLKKLNNALISTKMRALVLQEESERKHSSLDGRSISSIIAQIEKEWVDSKLKKTRTYHSELSTDQKILRCYGCNIPMKFKNSFSNLTEIHFYFIEFTSFQKQLTFIKSLRKLESLLLSNNNIDSFGQIQLLSIVSQLKSISFQNNDISNLPLYRHFIISFFPNIHSIDNLPISELEKLESSEYFQYFKQHLYVKASISNDHQSNFFHHPSCYQHLPLVNFDTIIHHLPDNDKFPTDKDSPLEQEITKRETNQVLFKHKLQRVWQKVMLECVDQVFDELSSSFA
ncbi:hypothetical protein RFI_20970 [Reticulomyxa filosa]|uniref:Uncharacterized protein n=1 Tax=Reticulomyxa filosa TaxID=46433 RepID=X6MRG8_RETFI|nr:hypothetical protein RFI_20970 [Reticulomyxa filosa]|eukprot:ETO16379.1 hypothetical protein RFI_20970 [Reticulomyxa filosa]